MKKPLLCLLLLGLGSRLGGAADQPQWGEAWSRNMVSGEKGLPESFDAKAGKNIKWSVQIGTETHGTPIVAGGRVYIGTNNEEPRDLKHTADSGVMMCFDEKTGSFLWQLVVPKREEDIFHDWPKTGMPSEVTVEGDRVYLLSNRGEVMCLDAKGMANGNDGPYLDEGAHMIPRSTNSVEEPVAGAQDADILWVCNLTTKAGIWSHDGAHASILIHGDYLYLNSCTGVDNTHKRIRTPDAPSLVVLDKKTGRLVARDDEHIAPDIFHCTWSSPSMAEINGRPLIIFASGNGVVYGFEPVAAGAKAGDEVRKLKKVWQFDFDPTAPKKDIHKYLSNRREGPSNIYGMPVVDHNRLYVAGGGDIWWGKNEAWLKCIDPTKTGDITTNGLIWSYPLEHHVLSTPAVYEGLVFIADCGRKMHCVDAETGKPYWTQEIKGEVWSSPLVADGKVYLGTRSGEFWVFAASTEKKVLSTYDFGIPISATATAANGVLYITTMKRL
ncbi:MAG: secondary metabolism, biosynthesis of secondary products derived from primary amino acid, partial [Pedosphaera sp.]|nr:secondary metabolism, biosynthesis of secondary products derived from primary amino acid [Pedosphaera sp.]